jgi:hypothetical protein
MGERRQRVSAGIAEKLEADGRAPGGHLVELPAHGPDRQPREVAFGLAARVAREVGEQRRPIERRGEEGGLVELLEISPDGLGGFGDVRGSQGAVLGLPGRPDETHRELVGHGPPGVRW